MDIKQLQQQGKDFAPRTVAEAVLVHHNANVVRLDQILSIKLENIESNEFNVTKEGLVGEVYNRTGNSATLKAQADTTQAVLDLMISGLYHKLEQPLTDNVPEPYGTWGKYSVRPEWSASLGKFVFDVRNESEDGIYYFFDEDEICEYSIVDNVWIYE